MKTNQYQFEQIILPFSVLGAIVLSLIFTSFFWISMGSTMIACACLCATGILLELTKFFALPNCIDFKRAHNWIGCVVSGIIFVILSLISMVAGIYALNKNISLNQDSSLRNSESYRMVLNSIHTQETKIEQMMALAHQDQVNGFRKRAGEIYQVIQSEQVVLDTLKNQLAGIQINTANNKLSIPLLNDRHIDYLVFILGTLLEMMTTYLILLYRVKYTSSDICKVVKPVKNEEKLIKHKPLSFIVFNERSKYENIVKKIKAKTIAPTQRAIKNAGQLGSDSVKQFLKQMEYDGIIYKSGSGRYQLN